MKTINFKSTELMKQNFNEEIKVIPTVYFDLLKEEQFPITFENAIIQISDFLMYINAEAEKYSTTLLTIDQNIFIDFFNRNTYAEFKRILQKLGIITNVPNKDGIWYSRDNHISKTYRIHNDYLREEEYTIIFFEKKKKEKKNININCPLNNVMSSTLINEELDYKKVFEYEIEYHKENKTSSYSLFIRLCRALSINKERYAKKGNKVNRIYHSFSNLSRITRKCFKTKFFNIDLKNAQPTLLLVHLKENGIDFETEYQTLCESGLFYEMFSSTGLKREDIKVECYKSIFFDFKETNKVNIIFKEKFPKLWSYMKSISETVCLATILQNIEASIFNTLEVKASSSYYTLFDAIYFNNKKDKEFIMKQLNKKANSLGIKFNLSFE